jgi:hypothetical protein
MVNDFNAVEEVNKTDARRELDFPVERIPLVTEPTPHERVDRLLVQRTNPSEDEPKKLGIVKSTRNHIPFPTINDWVQRELDKANMKWKLKESTVTKKGEMYQEYLFDQGIDTPDNEGMSPLLIVKGSYISTPMEAHFGTYRFVCSNGVMVGETIEKMVVKPNVQDLLQNSIVDELRTRLDRFQQVGQLYKKLDEENFQLYLWSVFADEYLGVKIKKEVLTLLQQEGSVEVTKEKIRSSDFENPENLIQVVDDASLTAWGFYNMVTQIATIHSKSVGSRMSNYKRVSKDFFV